MFKSMCCNIFIYTCIQHAERFQQCKIKKDVFFNTNHNMFKKSIFYNTSILWVNGLLLPFHKQKLT